MSNVNTVMPFTGMLKSSKLPPSIIKDLVNAVFRVKWIFLHFLEVVTLSHGS